MNTGYIASNPNCLLHRPNAGCLGLGRTEDRWAVDGRRMDGQVELKFGEHLTEPGAMLGTEHEILSFLHNSPRCVLDAQVVMSGETEPRHGLTIMYLEAFQNLPTTV